MNSKILQLIKLGDNITDEASIDHKDNIDHKEFFVFLFFSTNLKKLRV